MCFSPEKLKLLKVIKQENEDCEIKRFKRTEQKDILKSDHDSFRKLNWILRSQSTMQFLKKYQQ